MNQTDNAQVEIDPYRVNGAASYAAHHRKNLRTRLTTWREQATLASILEACPDAKSVLDLPCGTGRFWPVFEQAGVEKLLAADFSEAMLAVASARPPAIAEFECRQLNGFDIDLPDNSVDLISCQRFLHHVSHQPDRMKVLSELYRVSRSYVAVSLWVDGNFRSRKYVDRPIDPSARGFGRRICRQREEVEQEFKDAGFTIVDHYDVWPGLAMWRQYFLTT